MLCGTFVTQENASKLLLNKYLKLQRAQFVSIFRAFLELISQVYTDASWVEQFKLTGRFWVL